MAALSREENNMKQPIIGKIRRANKIRNKIKLVGDRLRLTVFRSNKYIYAQIIDDKTGKTLVAAIESELKTKDQKTQASSANCKTDKARELGKLIAEKALKTKITKVVFDKGPYLYHGRVKALAEGAREGGLEF